ncbi:hypothetical protein PoB_006647500 [Plakobranchus ocellatus]|uniref:Fork-head domain-containing protein n=1 Tax=Plakobranchus ocellatus TaxID=259542 RepID=A0AAV4D758_9GAST|nr:hypothetical protein PoB_006647500 [Plakobranchus ocellatus]
MLPHKLEPKTQNQTEIKQHIDDHKQAIKKNVLTVPGAYQSFSLMILWLSSSMMTVTGRYPEESKKNFTNQGPTWWTLPKGYSAETENISRRLQPYPGSQRDLHTSTWVPFQPLVLHWRQEMRKIQIYLGFNCRRFQACRRVETCAVVFDEMAIKTEQRDGTGGLWKINERSATAADHAEGYTLAMETSGGICVNNKYNTGPS